MNQNLTLDQQKNFWPMQNGSSTKRAFWILFFLYISCSNPVALIKNSVNLIWDLGLMTCDLAFILIWLFLLFQNFRNDFVPVYETMNFVDSWLVSLLQGAMFPRVHTPFLSQTAYQCENWKSFGFSKVAFK